MALSVPIEIGSDAPSAVLPGVLFAATLSDRDRAATATEAEVVRIGAWVHVTETGLRYRLTSRSPLTWVVDAEGGGGGGGDYVAALNIAARDSLTATPGLRVRVLTLPYTYEWNGESWAIVDVTPNTTASWIAELNNQTDGAARYIDPNNDTGNADDENPGTLALPWLTPDRLWDEIPDIPSVGNTGAGAFLTVIVLSDGFHTKRRTGFHNLGAVGIQIYCLPDLENITPTTSLGAPGAGAQVVAPDLATKVLGSQYEYTGLPAMPALTDGTHFVSQTFLFGGTQVFHFPNTIDGKLSDGPNGMLRVFGSDPIGFTTDARLYAYADVPALGVNSGNNLDLVDESTSIVGLLVGGFRATSSITNVTLDGVNVDGTSFDNSSGFNLTGAGDSGFSGPYVAPSFAALFRDCKNALIRGLWRRPWQMTSGKMIISRLMQRSAEFGEGMMHIGAFGGEPSQPTAAEVDHLDMDGEGTENGLHVNHEARVRTSNSLQGVVAIQCAKAFSVRGGGFLQLSGGRIFGRFTQPNEISGGSRATGLASIPSQGADGLTNSSTAGQDFSIDGGSTIDAWTDAPKNDYADGATAQGNLAG